MQDTNDSLIAMERSPIKKYLHLNKRLRSR